MLAAHVGDTFIDWNDLSPDEQWTRIVRMVETAPAPVRLALLHELEQGIDVTQTVVDAALYAIEDAVEPMTREAT